MTRLEVGHGWTVAPWILCIAMAFFFVERSLQSKMRLRHYPHPEFIGLRPEWDARRREGEERLANAYWEYGVTTLEWTYPYPSSLPAEPPPEFSVEGKGYPRGGIETSRATRLGYWEGLRKVWALPQTWEKKYEWSTRWLFGRNVGPTEPFAPRAARLTV